mgnify:CR=1 FL=1
MALDKVSDASKWRRPLVRGWRRASGVGGARGREGRGKLGSVSSSCGST